jgi:hypothetical protein
MVSGCGLLKTGENDTFSHTIEPTGKLILYTPVSTILPDLMSSPTSTGTPYPSVTTLSHSIPPAISTGIPSSQETKITLTEQPACPARLSPASLSLLHEGSILFSYQGVGTSSGIWAISAHNTVPTLVSESLSDYVIGSVLSPDGVRLAYIDYTSEPYMVILYDLRTGQSINIPKQEDWRVIREWLPDGRLKILTDLEEVEMVGIKYQYDIFDPVTESTVEITEVYELPEFQFIPHRWWSGFASIDPSRALVLYTAYVNNLTDIVLRDASTNEDIWRFTGSYFMSNLPIASWSSDGRMVAFVIAGYRNNITISCVYK